MYKIKDEIMNEVCEKLNLIARLSLEAEELLKKCKCDTPKTKVDYDPDEYIIPYLNAKVGFRGGNGR